MTETVTYTLKYRAMGFTEDINECALCGRIDLKGTVRLAVIGPDGGIEDEVYAGVVCAAKADGRKAGEIRDEARAADNARDAAHREWESALHNFEMDVTGRLLAERGLERRYPTVKLVEADPAYPAAMTAWHEANPEPERPARYRR
jgi:hypothetical protein